jgi:hypothetical protein
MRSIPGGLIRHHGSILLPTIIALDFSADG